MKAFKWFFTFLLIFLVGTAFAGTPDTKKYGIRFVDEGAAHSTPPSGYGDLYVNSDLLYFKTDGGTAYNILNTAATAWSDISNPTADKTITFDNDEITILSFADINEDMFTIRGIGAFGDVSVVRIESLTGDPTDGTVLEVVSHDANVDPLVISTSGQAGVLKVNQGGTVSIIGNTDITGTLSVTGAFYQSALAAAASGNTALTIDAAGTGTITIGGTSTGKITTDNTVEAFGAVDIGDGATDTLTITSIIDASVTLDDGTTDSPKLIFKDSDDEYASIYQDQDTNDLDIDCGGASEALAITTGNLSVGTPNVSVITYNGNDFFVVDDAEIDGTLVVDTDLDVNGTADISSTLGLHGAVTYTMAAAGYLKLDGDTTNQTNTDGALDINVGTATAAVEGINIKLTSEMAGAGVESGILIDLDDDSSAACTNVGLNIDASDAAGHANTVNNGILLGNALDIGINSVIGAAEQLLVVDATTTANTGVIGMIDINYRSATTTAQAINLDVESDVAGGASETVIGLKIQLDDDANTASDSLSAIYVGTDGDATGLQYGLNVVGAGIDYAVYAQNGAIRIGTGSTPGQTLGDDCLFVEGTAEVDGIIYADGGITGDGQANIVGMTRLHESYTGADNVITIAESGTIFDNTGDLDGSLHTLPEASTCIGAYFTFIVTAAQQIVVELDNADVFLHLTLDAGDQIQSSTVGDSITVVALDATNWGVLSCYPLSTDWADGGA